MKVSFSDIFSNLQSACRLGWLLQNIFRNDVN